jgi:hypothetical protein
MEFTQHHIKARNEDIAGYCFIPGDHVRGKKIAARLEDARLVADTRGYFVYTGTYKGVRVTVCSTGMGGPQVAIAMEELGNMGVHTFVRLGSAGGLDSRTGVGDIVIATGSYRGGGTGDEYLPKAFPARMADPPGGAWPGTSDIPGRGHGCYGSVRVPKCPRAGFLAFSAGADGQGWGASVSYCQWCCCDGGGRYKGWGLCGSGGCGKGDGNSNGHPDLTVAAPYGYPR